MKIISVEVKNYRSLKDVKVGSFKTINMLYGYNNTGKSNFLRFIEQIFSRKGRIEEITYDENGITRTERRRQVFGWWEGEFNHSAFMFTDDDKDSKITFKILMEIKHSELGKLKEKLMKDYLNKSHDSATICLEGEISSVTSTDSKILLTKVMVNRKMAYDFAAAQGTNNYFPSSKSLIGQAEPLNSLLAIFNDCVLFLSNDRYLLDEKEQPRISEELSAQNAKNWLFEYYMDSQKHDSFEKFISFIKKYQCEHKVEPAAKIAWQHWPLSSGDIGFSRFGQNIELMLRNVKGRFPLASYGTGVQQILYILAKLFFTKSPIVLVEEIELNLSPTSQRELIINMQRLLGTNQLNQLLFTTHSNYFLGRIDFQVFQAVLDDKGYTDIKGAKIADKKRFSRPDIN
jgi:AAA15 family ATPase/GTPase